MQDQRISAEPDEFRTDAAILTLLVDDDSHRPWAVEEVERELDDVLAVTDGLSRLRSAGLVHRLDGFVFATRPAVRAAELAQ
jgi:hypothetical protein